MHLAIRRLHGDHGDATGEAPERRLELDGCDLFWHLASRHYT